MPLTKAQAEKIIKARWGAVRWRTHTAKNGAQYRVAVVRKPGPRGGLTVSYRI
jgi:hypothetical protein